MTFYLRDGIFIGVIIDIDSSLLILDQAFATAFLAWRYDYLITCRGILNTNLVEFHFSHFENPRSEDLSHFFPDYQPRGISPSTLGAFTALCPLTMRHDSRGRQKTAASRKTYAVSSDLAGVQLLHIAFLPASYERPAQSCKRVDHHDGDDVRGKKHALLPAIFLRKAKLRPKRLLAPAPSRSFKEDC